MGSTPNGRDWCLKALHPSDPITEVQGIPDESSVPSMFMNYQSVYTVSCPQDSVGYWECDGQLIPNPLSFGAAVSTGGSSSGPLKTASVEFVNSQVPGSGARERLENFLADFRRWRLAYASVTIYQDGPDLANQGTVVACQKPVEPQLFNSTFSEAGESAPGWQALHHLFHMDDSDKPTYTRSQAMPNAYFGKSRDGLYMPLKLTKTHQAWHSAKDLVYQANNAQLIPLNDYAGGYNLVLPQTGVYNSTGVYPFLSLNDAHITNVTSADFFTGTLTSPFCNENWGDFSFRNMATTTSLSFFFRFGFEMQLQPTSMLSPHLKISPEADYDAIRAYFAISREMKDAYPADFNDLGKIWNVISSIGKKIAPALSLIPGVGGLLATGAPMLLEGIDKLVDSRKRVSGPTQGNVASASDIQAVREAEREAIRKVDDERLRKARARVAAVAKKGSLIARARR